MPRLNAERARRCREGWFTCGKRKQRKSKKNSTNDSRAGGETFERGSERGSW